MSKGICGESRKLRHTFTSYTYETNIPTLYLTLSLGLSVRVLWLHHKAYIPKKAPVLTRQEINKFLHEAPDEEYMFEKVVLSVAVVGMCRCRELANLRLSDVVQLDESFLISVMFAKNFNARSFQLVGWFYVFIRNYLEKRAAIRQEKFFLVFRGTNPIDQPASYESISKIPKKVATFLGLKNADDYTSHSMKRSSATAFIESGGTVDELQQYGKWKSPSCALGYYEEALSTKNRRAHQLTNAIMPINSSANSTSSFSTSTMVHQATSISQANSTITSETTSTESSSTKLIDTPTQPSIVTATSQSNFAVKKPLAMFRHKTIGVKDTPLSPSNISAAMTGKSKSSLGPSTVSTAKIKHLVASNVMVAPPRPAYIPIPLRTKSPPVPLTANVEADDSSNSASTSQLNVHQADSITPVINNASSHIYSKHRTHGSREHSPPSDSAVDTFHGSNNDSDGQQTIHDQLDDDEEAFLAILNESLEEETVDPSSIEHNLQPRHTSTPILPADVDSAVKQMTMSELFSNVGRSSLDQDEPQSFHHRPPQGSHDPRTQRQQQPHPSSNQLNSSMIDENINIESEFRVGPAAFKFFNCDVTININVRHDPSHT